VNDPGKTHYYGDDCDPPHTELDPIPATVRAMADDPQAPTAPLEDFMTAMRYDDNWWWRIGCGHHLNLFEAVLDRLEINDVDG